MAIDDYKHCAPGTIVKLPRRSGFKIAIVTGYSRTGKIKVRVWSDNSRCWSNPQYVRMADLETIITCNLSTRHWAVYKRARDHALERGGTP